MLVSPELDEIMELSDRIAVMYRGEIIAVVPPNRGVSKEQIGLLMAGVVPEGEIPTDENVIIEATF